MSAKPTRVLLLAIVALSTLVSTSAGLAQPPNPSRSENPTSTTFLPVLGSAPETGFQFGLTALRMYRTGPDSTTRTSQQQIYAVYTAKSQARGFVQVERWSRENLWHTRARAEYQRFPLPYYGIGSDSPSEAEEWYTSAGPALQLLAQRRVKASLYAGAGLRVSDVSISETDPVGSLVAGTITGSRGGTLAQAEANLARDSRDNVIASHSGSMVQLTSLFSNAAWGSDFDFTRYAVDLRYYRAFGGDQHVVAAQLLADGIRGAAPFDQLVQFGSDTQQRGYTRGRYRDNYGASAQVEYRSPFVKRLGMVGFAGAGTVAPTFSDLSSGAILPSYGVGLRALLNPSQRATIRVDYGRGKGSSGLYISLGEAF